MTQLTEEKTIEVKTEKGDRIILSPENNKVYMSIWKHFGYIQTCLTKDEASMLIWKLEKSLEFPQRRNK